MIVTEPQVGRGARIAGKVLSCGRNWAGQRPIGAAESSQRKRRELVDPCPCCKEIGPTWSFGSLDAKKTARVGRFSPSPPRKQIELVETGPTRTRFFANPARADQLGRVSLRIRPEIAGAAPYSVTQQPYPARISPPFPREQKQQTRARTAGQPCAMGFIGFQQRNPTSS